jgi:aspartyl-tRNA(Asn)/glutamyl-tRNA(Gln) amidotransferase subunit A
MNIDLNDLSRREVLLTGAVSAVGFTGGRAFAQSGDPTDLTIAGAGQLIRSGEISPRDLVDAYLDRIEQIDGRLNSYITVTADRAQRRARELETEIASGNWRGPLHGIPIALKDNIDTAGVLTTAASGVYADRIPAESAEVVTRLEAAGAIVLGKLNMHEFAFGASSVITHYGPVHNPWDLERIPAGSSGGSGAAVAARLCAGALGTDTGGSIRMPAAHCGIVGFKPTYGLSSIRGIIPLSYTYDHVGPMTRTVADAALLLQGMAGYDPRGIASLEAQLPTYISAITRRTSALRIGVPRANFYENIDPQIAQAIERALEVLGELTDSVRDVELPPLASELPIVVSEAFSYHAPLLEDRRDRYHPETLNRVLSAQGIATADYVNAMNDVTLARKAIAAVFEDVDVLVTPTVPLLPIRIDDERAVTSDLALTPNTVPFNTFGIPAISLPCGFSREGLPIGLQISGPRLGELDVLALAHAYEQATDWHELRPPLT